ncbi:MAG: hypothetical protein U0Q22_01125 [Acidimicrobiales bacterium]
MDDIRPLPTDEDAAAIVAALDAAWPRAGAAESRDAAPRWRWSGRWWTKPMVIRRDRP